MIFNLFGKKQQALGSEQYEFNRSVEGKNFTIKVDMILGDTFLQRKTHSNLVMVAFTFDKSFSDSDDLSEKLRDATKELGTVTKALLVGTIQSDDMLIGYIATTTQLNEAVVRDMIGSSRQPYTITFSEDPGWTFIMQTLFPTDAERQRGNNVALIGLITAEQGHNTPPPTGVEHSIGFKNMESGAGFLEKIATAGYYRIGMQSTQDRTYPLLFTFGKQCVVTLQEVNAQTDYLVPLAEGQNGRYEGWQGTTVSVV